MRTDIYVFTSNMGVALGVLRQDHGAERLRERANQLVLPDRKVVEIRPLNARVMPGMRIEPDQCAHLWNFPDCSVTFDEYDQALMTLKMRFAPAGYKDRIHTETGQL